MGLIDPARQLGIPEPREGQGVPGQQSAQAANFRQSRVQRREMTALAQGPQHRLMLMVLDVIDETTQMHPVAGGQMAQ